MRNLIVYFSRKGSTRELVEQLAAKLYGETDIESIKNKPEVSGYDNVILGGAVIAGSVKGGMKNYAAANLEKLKKVKVALFVCCLDNDAQRIESYFANSFPAELLEQAVAKESLGGAYQPHKENFLVRFMMKSQKAEASEVVLAENMDRIAASLDDVDRDKSTL